MRIRPATLADLTAASQLWHERVCLLQQTDGLIQLRADAMIAWQREAGKWLAVDDCAVFVAEAQGELTGYIAVIVCAGEAGLNPERVGRLLSMAIDLHQPRAGLSSLLLEHASAWLRENGADALQVDAPLAYPVEAAFWRGQGAKAVSQRLWLPL